MTWEYIRTGTHLCMLSKQTSWITITIMYKKATGFPKSSNYPYMLTRIIFLFQVTPGPLHIPWDWEGRASVELWHPREQCRVRGKSKGPPALSHPGGKSDPARHPSHANQTEPHSGEPQLCRWVHEGSPRLQRALLRDRLLGFWPEQCLLRPRDGEPTCDPRAPPKRMWN